MRLVWTRRAHLDRNVIRTHIAKDNPSAAMAMDALFSAKAARLASHPDIGRPGRVPGTRELVAHSKYVLVYDISVETVRVLRLLHTSRQWPPGDEHPIDGR